MRVISGGPVDASAFRLFADGKVRGDSDMVFYGQPRNEDGSISFSAEGTNSVFTVDLSRLKPDVQKVAFTVTCDGSHTVSSLNHLSIQIESGNTSLISGQVELSGRQEAALILGEVYRRNGDWKFRFIAQGFNGGLKPLAEYYGVNVADEPAPVTPPPAPPAPPKVSLSKVSLTKEKPAISLAKKDNFGEIRINLNWHRGSGSGGLLGGMFGSNKAIDRISVHSLSSQMAISQLFRHSVMLLVTITLSHMFNCRVMIVPARLWMGNGYTSMAANGKKFASTDICLYLSGRA